MMSADPTVVLVHGAFADASGYAAVIRILQAQGIAVRAPMNPLRGLASDADAIARYATTIDGPIVLVGHSYGGAVISQAAPAVEDVRALVFLSAFALDEGESCATVQQAFPPPLLASTNIASPYDAPGAAGGPDLFVKIADFHETFCADLPDEVAAPMSVSH
jgi:pimeloyl-ACP methyl ester carboxylesterase